MNLDRLLFLLNEFEKFEELLSDGWFWEPETISSLFKAGVAQYEIQMAC